MKKPDGGSARAWKAARWPVYDKLTILTADMAQDQLPRVLALVLEQSEKPRAEPRDRQAAEAARAVLAEPVKFARVREDLRNVEGVFVTVSRQPERDYDLAAKADPLARDAEQLNATDIGALLRFLGTWGQLGVGLVGPALISERVRGTIRVPSVDTIYALGFPEIGLVSGSEERKIPVPSYETRHALAGHDSVAAVRAEIQAWQRAAQELQRLQQRNRRASPEEWERLFAPLNPYLERMRPSVSWSPETGAIPVWVVETPADMLWAVFYDWATRGGHLCRCPQCGVLFPAAHPRQKFCSVTCTNRASAAAWYRRKGRRLRQAKRQASNAARRRKVQ